MGGGYNHITSSLIAVSLLRLLRRRPGWRRPVGFLHMSARKRSVAVPQVCGRFTLSETTNGVSERSRGCAVMQLSCPTFVGLAAIEGGIDRTGTNQDGRHHADDLPSNPVQDQILCGMWQGRLLGHPTQVRGARLIDSSRARTREARARAHTRPRGRERQRRMLCLWTPGAHGHGLASTACVRRYTHDSGV